MEKDDIPSSPDLHADVKEFYKKFELGLRDKPEQLRQSANGQLMVNEAIHQMSFTYNFLVNQSKPEGWTKDDEFLRFRTAAMLEELIEYLQAVRDCDLAGQFDALVDLTYFAVGTAEGHKFPFNDGWDLVHASNMSKERAESNGESKRFSKWDVVKPHGFVAPDLKLLLEQNPHVEEENTED